MRQLKAIFIGLCALVAGAGCVSWGFQKYDPGDINVYDEMLAGYTADYGNSRWIWVQGKVSGDIDGDNADEDIVLATVHPMPKDKENAPILQAIMLICQADPAGDVQLLRRVPVFDSKTTWQDPTLSLPDGVHLSRPQETFYHCSARIVDAEDTGRGVILLSVWSREINHRFTALHQAYDYDDNGPPHLAFQSLAIQRDPVLDATDLDKDGRDELILEQAVCPVAKTTESNLEQPQWASVFGREPGKQYLQNDAAYPSTYQGRLLPWYEAYVRGIHDNRAPDRQLVYAYYLGLCHQRLGNPADARPFLERAATHPDKAIADRASEVLKTLPQ